jgi:hypothetical protein
MLSIVESDPQGTGIVCDEGQTDERNIDIDGVFPDSLLNFVLLLILVPCPLLLDGRAYLSKFPFRLAQVLRVSPACTVFPCVSLLVPPLLHILFLLLNPF